MFTVTNGKQTYHKTEMFSGSKQVVTAFSDLQPGDWDVDVVAKEAVESTKYDVFHGQGQSTVVAKKTTSTQIEMSVKKSSMILAFDFLEGSSDVRTLKIELSDGVSPPIAKELTRSEAQNSVTFTDLRAADWVVRIEAFGENGAVNAGTDATISVKPGRTVDLSVEIGSGVVSIDPTGGTPPGKPTNLSVDATPKLIKLRWNPALGNASYAVARSTTIDGKRTVLTSSLLTTNEYLEDPTDWKTHQYYYWVAAYDHDGQFSGWAGPILIKKKYSLDITIDRGGSVKRTPDDYGSGYEYGTLVEVEAVPDEGFRFVGWQGDASGKTRLTLGMSSNMKITAVFEPIIPLELKVPEAYPSIQAAIDAAKEGDTIIVSPGTYFENLSFKGKSRITLTSVDPLDPAVVQSTIINGNNKGACITVEYYSTDITISGFTMTGGFRTGKLNSFDRYGGAVCVLQSLRIAITNSIITGNTAQVGGGIYASYSDVTIKDSIISGNTALLSSGGIQTDTSSLTIIGSTLSNNTAMQNAGGIYVAGGTLTITSSEISGNEARDSGGISTLETEDIIITDTVVTGNKSSEYDAGGIRAVYAKTVRIISSSISNNETERNGGGLFLVNVKETFIVDCTISDNKAASGGGICALDSGEITLINTAICNNTAANAGGIVMTYTGDLPTVASKFFLTDCKISGNTSSHGTLLEHNAAVIVKGSEVHVKSSDLSQNNTRGLTILDANEASVIESVISKNTYGGVLVASSARIAIHDSTISENDSAYHGAGVCVYNTGSFTMTGSTIAENTTNWHGGGIYVNFEHQFNSKNSFYTVVDISNSDICNNSSAKLGGGIYLSPLKDITITSSRICANTAEHGGGVYAQEAGRAGVLTVAGSIVSGNRASADGGDLWIRSLNFTLTGNTITNNTSFYKGGGIYTTSSSTITMTDNIISNNSSEQSLGGGLWVGYLVRIKDSQGNILEVPTEVKAINTFFDNTPDDISFY